MRSLRTLSCPFLPQSKDTCTWNHKCICLRSSLLALWSDWSLFRPWTAQGDKICLSVLPDLSLRLKRGHLFHKRLLLMTYFGEKVMETSADLRRSRIICWFCHLRIKCLPLQPHRVTSSIVKNAENVHILWKVGKLFLLPNRAKAGNWVLGARSLNTWRSDCWDTDENIITLQVDVLSHTMQQ